MQIIINIKDLKCSFFYKWSLKKPNQDNIDKELIEFAKRLSQSISSDIPEIEIWKSVNLEDISSSLFQSRKSINLIFRCFDKKTGGNPIKEKITPLTLFFNLIRIGNLDTIIQSDQYIKLEEEDFILLDTLLFD